MYDELSASILNGIGNIDILLRNRVEERANEPTRLKFASWGDDSALSASVTAIKDISKVLSNSCIKLILLLRAGPSDSILKSLLDELNSQILALLAQYL